ncbi:MAG: Fic family protein, partial [Dongiaceae bacterium]
MSLTAIPYQRSWAEALQNIQLKQEAAGTSRIEGAEFTERELEVALRDETPDKALTRSQRQARAAINTYRWIANLPVDRPVTPDLIREIHGRIVTGCDDDHCPPGQTRSAGENVTFGTPRHRGVEGGRECDVAFRRLGEALEREFRGHDLLIQALALHYHIGAMHPFLDGNGRTARAAEALFLQRAGLKDELFIAMSNYYYDEKVSYLATLSEVRAANYDLTAFLRFGLKGIATQCGRLLSEIRTHVSKSLFREMMYDLFNRLKSTRRRVIAERQIEILKILLDVDSIDHNEL